MTNHRYLTRIVGTCSDKMMNLKAHRIKLLFIVCTAGFGLYSISILFRQNNPTQKSEYTKTLKHLVVDRDEMNKKYGDIRPNDVISVNTTLTPEEERRMSVCIRNGPRDRDENGSKFWRNAEIRREHHTYLREDGAVLIEVGGNLGEDASEFVRLYNPHYLILEPLAYYAELLKKKFKTNRRVIVVNLGLGLKNEVVMVTIDGKHADATSKFAQKSTSGDDGGTTVPIHLANTTEFLIKFGVGFFDVDLITLNCEGCEFEALEALLSTNVIRHFRNIQISTHSTIPGLTDPIGRYCRIQELLSRTHRPTYQYRFIWESWRRKDFSSD